MAGCTPAQMAVSGNLMGRYGTLAFTAGGEEYFMQVNQWNTTSTGMQTLAYGGDFFFKMTQQGATVSTDGPPSGYPSIFIGANNRHATMGSNLPRAVTSLTTVPTTLNWDDAGTLSDSTNNSYNTAYDVWFSTGSGGDPNAAGPSGGFLMVWLHKPADAIPIGTKPSFEGVTIAGVPGTWDVWQGKNGSRPCISYVATQPTKSLSFDLNAFIKDAVANRPGDTIQSGWYLTNVFAGFEIWRGGQNLQITNFCAIVN
jgi:hypothetical protein